MILPAEFFSEAKFSHCRHYLAPSQNIFKWDSTEVGICFLVHVTFYTILALMLPMIAVAKLPGLVGLCSITLSFGGYNLSITAASLKKQ